jgi:excinuclease ABC subunit A
LRDLPDVRMPCDVCGGRRYAPETDAVRVKGMAMADVLLLRISEAALRFRDVPRVGPVLRAAEEVGLGYLPLGAATTRISSGEALRLRLAAALGRGGVGPTLYLLEEPAAGLHPDDVSHLVELLLRITAEGHAVVAVEHDLTVVASADHVVELGPGAGPAGGRVLYQGPPAGLLDVATSPTGEALREER